MSSDMNFDGFGAVAQWTYGFDFAPLITSAPTSTAVEHPSTMPPSTSGQPMENSHYAEMVPSTSHQFRAPSPLYNTISPPPISQSPTSSAIDHSDHGFIPLDPALMNGSSSESFFTDAPQSDDSAMYSTPNESESPEPPIDQLQADIFTPVLDERMDLHQVAGAVIPMTVGLEHWIVDHDPDVQLQIFQVIGKLSSSVPH
jgi:hypothetical protein